MKSELTLLHVSVNEKGQLCDARTDERLRFVPHAAFHLLLNSAEQVLAGDVPYEVEVRCVVPKDEVLRFELKQTEWGTLYVWVQLLEDVCLYKDDERKPPQLGKYQRCQIVQVNSESMLFEQEALPFEPIEATTLNQAYFLASKRYEIKRPSHTGNVHTKMQTAHAGRTLREMWDIVKHQPSYWWPQS